MTSEARNDCNLDALVGFLCEVIAWTLYGLSRVRLAPRPCYTSSIAECKTCGYRMDRNGFPRFPLYRLAREFEAEIEQSRRLRSLAGNRVKCMACHKFGGEREYSAWKYFCGTCWKKIREKSPQEGSADHVLD